MAIPDKLGAARTLESLLRSIIQNGGLKLRYRITIDPPMADERDWERPQIFVDLSGPDAEMLLERGAELLRAVEMIAQQALDLPHEDHDKLVFDCMNHRAMRLQELKMAAGVAAERVRKTGRPYRFAPMTSRERRILHLALRDQSDLRTESEGAGPERRVVVLPKDYQLNPAISRH